MRTPFVAGSLFVVLTVSASWAQTPLGTAFRYQGQLKDAGVPANGLHDLRFRLYDAAAGGGQVGPTRCTDNVSVTDGLFTVSLDFGEQFAGDQRFLEIDVRAETGLDCANPAGFVTLAPRQPLTATPYALYARSVPVPLTLSGTSATHIVRGENASATSGASGVAGYATATTGFNYGVYGKSASTDGHGVFGEAIAATGYTFGGRFDSYSSDGTGVFAWARAPGGRNYGVYGASSSTEGMGVFGLAGAKSGTTCGVYGLNDSTDGKGVMGWASMPGGTNYGVVGLSESPTGYGVFGAEPPGGAGHAVYAAGSFAATGTKSFQIDHPLRPETHYLNHFCTEGPEPYDTYRGNVVTDAKGYATVTLPLYFESINRDPTYHLTVIDDSDDFVLAKVVRKIQNNQFVIRTSMPHVEVSWRVEAVRNDRWVQEYGFQTEQEKEDAIKGKYLHPELYGQPPEMGMNYAATRERPEPQRPSRERPSPPAPPEASPD